MFSRVRRSRLLVATLLTVALTSGCGAEVLQGKGEYDSGFPVAPATYQKLIPGPAATIVGSTKIAAPDGLLRTPSSGTTETAVRTMKSITDAEAQSLQLDSGGGVTAPAGYEFIATSFSSEGVQPTFPKKPAPVKTEVVIGTKPTEVDLHGTYSETVQIWSRPAVVLVLSVPIGQPVLLQMTDSGKTATLDLRTGKRAADAGTKAMDLLLSDHQQLTIGKPYTAAGAITTAPPAQFIAETIPYAVTFDFSKAYAVVLPWRPGKGYAPAGKAWLLLAGLSVSEPDIGAYGTGAGVALADFALSVADSLSVTPSGAAAVKAEAQTLTIEVFGSYADPLGNGQGAAFLVPATFVTGTLTLAPTGSFVVKYAEGDVPAAWSTAPAPYSVAVDLRK